MKVRHVSFDDELGVLGTVKEVVKTLENKLVSLEKRLNKFPAVGKENAEVNRSSGQDIALSDP